MAEFVTVTVYVRWMSALGVGAMPTASIGGIGTMAGPERSAITTCRRKPLLVTVTLRELKTAVGVGRKPALRISRRACATMRSLSMDSSNPVIRRLSSGPSGLAQNAPESLVGNHRRAKRAAFASDPLGHGVLELFVCFRR